MAESKPKPRSASGEISETASKPGKLRWIVGWVLMPLTFFGLLFLGGVHVGARHPTMFWSKAVLWVFKAEPSLGPSEAADHKPMARRMLLKMLPAKDYALRVSLSEAELAELAEQAGTAPATLECETACRLLWAAEQPDKEFLAAESCELTPGQGETPTKLACDAKVQR